VVVLWWWMKLGILGLLAYLAVMASYLAMSWQVWRRSADPLLSAAGLAVLCGVLALVVVETVGSFTGVDPRFTALVGAVGGMLVVMRRLALRPA
jgi:O-antigen ligase